MVRGLYSAAAGVFSQQKVLNVISNNMTNASTVGFKSQTTVESSFGEHLVSRLNSSDNDKNRTVGTGAFLTVNGAEYTDFSQGVIDGTGRAQDMAIQGEGFFLVESEEYGEVLTRNGQFELDEDGYLVLPGVGKVLNESKNSIQLKSSDFTVTGSGAILENGKETDTLYIGMQNEGAELERTGEGLYLCKDGYQKTEAESYQIVQEALEKSNTDIVREMSRIIAGQNNYQSCIQIIKMNDKINEITVNQIGRIG